MSGEQVPTRDVTTSYARTLVDEWVRCGVRDACLAPGSRSAPLALALAHDTRVRLHVHPDERSASFFALGIAKATDRPVLVVCTSGTAAANFHPAVLEAHHSRTPLVVCTADRPPELRDTGAGQTIDQTHLYGSATRWFVDPGPPVDEPDAPATWRALAARSVAEAVGPPAGPVHCNLPFREPLVPTGAPLVDAPGRADGRPWTAVTTERPRADDATIARVASLVDDTPHGVLAAGWGAGCAPDVVARFAAAAGWPLLADGVSGLRSGPHAISTYDALLRVDAVAASLRPDLVLRVGAPLTSKATNRAIGPEVHMLTVDPDRAWLDPRHAAAELLAVDPDDLLTRVTERLAPRDTTPWLEQWLDAERAARATIDDVLDSHLELFEGRIARDVMASVPAGGTLVVASSMPIRDVESFAAPRDGLRVLANRGVNGIDGFVSTTLGVAAAAGGAPVVALLGDLCFLHDSNGLIGCTELDATFVVVDNDGGGIFSFLPQADSPEHFEQLFGTPHGLDLRALCAGYGVAVTEIEKAADLTPALETAQRARGVHVVLARTQRADNAAQHRVVWDAVAAGALTG